MSPRRGRRAQSAKKQKLRHEPSDIEDQPSRRSQKREAAKARSAEREARSAGYRPWGNLGQISTVRGTPPEQQAQTPHSPDGQQAQTPHSLDSQLQIAQRNHGLASDMDQARIRQLEAQLFAAHALAADLAQQVAAEKAARLTLEADFNKLKGRFTTLEARSEAAEAREAAWQQQIDWSEWQTTATAPASYASVTRGTQRQQEKQKQQ